MFKMRTGGTGFDLLPCGQSWAFFLVSAWFCICRMLDLGHPKHFRSKTKRKFRKMLLLAQVNWMSQTITGCHWAVWISMAQTITAMHDTACYIMLQHQCKEKTLRFNALDASKLLDLSDNVATYLWLLTVWTRTACVCSQASSSTFVFSIEAPRGMVLCPMVSMFFLLRKHL